MRSTFSSLTSEEAAAFFESLSRICLVFSLSSFLIALEVFWISGSALATTLITLDLRYPDLVSDSGVGVLASFAPEVSPRISIDDDFSFLRSIEGLLEE